MKTKALFAILFLFLNVLYINAQITFNPENIIDLFDEKIKPTNNINFLIKSANNDAFVLDSSVHISYHSGGYMDTCKYYYTYDSKGNIIEEVNYNTNEPNTLHNYKHLFSYDENDSITGIVQYDLDLNTRQWILRSETLITYLISEKRIESVIFKYNDITKEYVFSVKLVTIQDKNGNVISNTRYNWDESLEWYPKLKEETNFDEKGRFLGTVNYRWNDSENQLKYSEKLVVEYGEDENHSLITRYNFDENSEQWIGYEQTRIVQEDGRYIEYVVSDWDNDLNQWGFNYMYEWTYDTYGNETSFSSYEWALDENIWKTNTKLKSSYSYTLKGLLESISNYTMDTTNQWIGIDKKEYLYNESGKEISYIESDWDVTANDWIVSSKTEREYNSGNKEIARVGYKWDTTISDWVFSYKNEKKYNSSNQITLTATYNWDNDQKEWDITGKNLYEFDIYGHNTKASKYVVYRDEVLELTETNEYFYSKLVTNINNIISEFEVIKVYPNPATETFTIETQNQKTVFGKLYDLNGELVKNLTIEQGTNTYNISGLQSGVYFIQIPQKEGMFVKKLVKN